MTKISNTIKNPKGMFSWKPKVIKRFETDLVKEAQKCFTSGKNFRSNSVNYFGKERIRNFKYKVPYGVNKASKLVKTEDKKNIQMKSFEQIGGKELKLFINMFSIQNMAALFATGHLGNYQFPTTANTRYFFDAGKLGSNFMDQERRPKELFSEGHNFSFDDSNARLMKFKYTINRRTLIPIVKYSETVSTRKRYAAEHKKIPEYLQGSANNLKDDDDLVYKNEELLPIEKELSPVEKFERQKLKRKNYMLYYTKQNSEKIKRKNREYYQKNRAKLNENQKLYQRNNKEKVAEINKRHRAKYKEKIIERNKEYYLLHKQEILGRQKENKELINKKLREYRMKNKEKINELQRQYYMKNKEKFNEDRRELYRKNKEKVNEYQKQYREKKKLQKIQEKLESDLKIEKMGSVQEKLENDLKIEKIKSAKEKLDNQLKMVSEVQSKQDKLSESFNIQQQTSELKYSFG